MKITTPFRVPLFLEIDLEAGEMQPADGHGIVNLPIHATGGRIVTEDGTILGKILFDVEAGDAQAGG